MKTRQLENSFRHRATLAILEETKELEEMAQDTGEEYQQRLQWLREIPNASIGRIFSILGQLAYDCPAAISIFIESIIEDPEELEATEVGLIPMHWDT